MRARTHFEDIDKGARQAIIIDELPYQVNKATLLMKIGEMVREKRLEGIAEIRDESDKSGMRAVIELKRGEVAEIILNNLYKETQMQDSFGVNMVALVDRQPRLLNLKQMLEAFLRHRREVITRRTVFELKKARERGHEHATSRSCDRLRADPGHLCRTRRSLWGEGRGDARTLAG